MGVDLSIGERVHMIGKLLGFLKVCWCLYCYIATNISAEHEQAGINKSVFKRSPTKIIKHCRDTVLC